MSKAHHFAPPLLVVFLGCTVLSGGAQAGWLDFGASKPETKAAAPAAKDKAPAPGATATLDESIRQAQLLRLAGDYPEAVKHLSQLMIVAADDPRVVTEYGKTLAMMGRASDAVNFLTRAEQLQPTDWSIYSALGVAYDQIGNQKQAQAAYEHALTLRPGEPSVLNNYALSRLLAKDTDMARNLAGRAELANAASKDDKIARNIAMIRSMAPEKAAPSLAANKPVAAPIAQNFTPVAQQAMPHQPQKVTQTALPAPTAPVAANRVVMQRVPLDPLAGPVAARAPRALQALAKPEAVKTETAKTNPVPAKPVAEAEKAKSGAKAEPVAAKVAAKPEPVAAKAEAAKPEVLPAKMDVKPVPASKPQAKTAEVKPVAMADAKPLASAKAVVNLDAATLSKTDAKAPAPKVLPPTPVKAASAKAVKPETKPDDKAIPGLRLSANAF